MNALLALFLLTIASCTTATTVQAWNEDKEPYRNSYERQLDEYRRTGVDTYRNGPLYEAQEDQRRMQGRSYDQQRQQEERRSYQEQTRRDSYQDTYRNSGGYNGGYSGGDSYGSTSH